MDADTKADTHEDMRMMPPWRRGRALPPLDGSLDAANDYACAIFGFPLAGPRRYGREHMLLGTASQCRLLSAGR